ncbi:MAG: glycosyltransferase [Pyrinomonadaceae bacterium]
MISGRNIIIISSIDWDFNWQGPQEIASRLARSGNRVLFIENTGVRMPALKDLSRVKTRFLKWGRGQTKEGFSEVQENLFVYSPLVAPPFGSTLRRNLNRKVFLPAIKKIADKLEMKDAVIWTFLPTDTASDIIKLLWDKKNPIIYYVAGDFDRLVSNVKRLRKSEKEIVGISNTVLTICRDLSDRYRGSHDKVYTFPYGVDLFAFRNGVETRVPESVKSIVDAGLNEERVPLIGYVGAIHRHVNLPMLEEAARIKKEWQWQFVGPVHSDVTKLEKLPNVSFMGQQTHKDLVHFIDRFDVCTIPYVKSAYTDTVIPVKLNEYLAMGKPVVATDIPLVKEFNDVHKVIDICTNEAGDFVSRIQKYISKKESEKVITRRKEVASLADWRSRFESIIDVIGVKEAQ